MAKNFYFALPDNEEAFYAYVNLVINNRQNTCATKDFETRPKHFGPVKSFSVERNEVGERFIVVYSFKDYKFLEMICDQFCLLRAYWGYIENAVKYPYASKYDVSFCD